MSVFKLKFLNYSTPRPEVEAALYSAIQETVRILRIVLPAVFFGLLASKYVYSIPQFRKLVDYISSHIRMKSSVAVAAFLIHPVAAYTILSELVRSGIIDEKEAVIATLVGTFPRTLRLCVLFLIPVAVPALGIWGVYYVLLILLTRGIISLAGLAIARKTLSSSAAEVEIPEITLKDTLRRFVRIALTLSITVFAVMLMFNAGVMGWLNSELNPILSSLGLPTPSLLIVATGFPSMLAAIATAGSLLAKGVIAGKPLLISLFLASIAHSVVEVSRNTFPVAASIMGRSLGMKVALCILLSRIAANLIALAILIVV